MDTGYIIAQIFLIIFFVIVIIELFKEIYRYYKKLNVLSKELEEYKKIKKNC